MPQQGQLDSLKYPWEITPRSGPFRSPCIAAIRPDGQNIGFAVPVDKINLVLKDLRTGRPVRMRTVAWSLVTCALTEYADGHNYSD